VGSGAAGEGQHEKGAEVKPSDIGLKSDSFKNITDKKVSRRVILNVEAGPKMGKTHFGLEGAPSPIVLFNFDQGLEGMLEKFLPKKQIIVAGVPSKTQKFPSYQFARPIPLSGESRKSDAYLDRVKRMAYPMWERFVSDFQQFLESEARTGIIDTGTAAYGLARFAYVGMDKGRPSAKQDPYGQRSGDMKAIFQGLVSNAYNYDKNVIWLHREKELWAGGEPSGRYAAAGYPDIAYEVQMTIRLKKEKIKGKDGKRVEDHVAIVKECRLDPMMEGERFEGRYCTFKSVMATVFGTEEEEWD
jgi:hypothetical protein